MAIMRGLLGMFSGKSKQEENNKTPSKNPSGLLESDKNLIRQALWGPYVKDSVSFIERHSSKIKTLEELFEKARKIKADMESRGIKDSDKAALTKALEGSLDEDLRIMGQVHRHSTPEIDSIIHNYDESISEEICRRDEQRKFEEEQRIQEKKLANIVQALLDAGTDVNEMDDDLKTALSQCLERKTLEAACELLKSAAQYEKDVSFLKFLLEHHFPVNAKDRNGGNVLFEPCISAEAVSILVRAGADVNAVDKDGHNCLYNTIFANAVKALTEAGANPNVGMSWHGYNNPASLEVLIDAGAYVNDINEKGRTALIKTVETDSPDKKDIAEVYLIIVIVGH